MKELVTAFGYPFFARTVIPGTIFLLLLWPFLSPSVGQVIIGQGASFVEKGTAFIVMAVFIGWLVSLLDYPIYMVYEGRALWPHRLSQWMQKRLQGKVDRMVRLAESVRDTDPSRLREIYWRLRVFPVESDGRYRVSAPTKLGNLLQAYERYSITRYGMDSVFYWPRIKFLVDKDMRESISTSAAEASALVYASFALFVAGILYLGTAVGMDIASLLRWKVSTGIPIGFDAVTSGLFGAFLVVLAYGAYRASLHPHRNYGELFKAVFDVYRKELKVRLQGETTPQDEGEYWKSVFNRLQYSREKRS